MRNRTVLTKKKKREICDKVILHWWTNLLLAYAGQLETGDIHGSSCEFCRKLTCAPWGNGIRRICPIYNYTGIFNCGDTYWSYIHRDLDHKNPVVLKRNTAKMLKFLEKICDRWLNGEISDTL
jgi:hypothetical protein